MAQEALNEVLFEFVQQGRYVKVTAIEPTTNTEVSVVGDAGASPDTLKRVALNKLRYVLTRGQGQVHALRRDDNLY
jgi:hypothetical protein